MQNIIIWGSRSGKTNALLNLIIQQLDMIKFICMLLNPHEAKYQFLFNKCECSGC